ncbi:MAG TPA: membrane protein insertion efficiency factor YidD [Candidatus Paceibacterota bacterium]|nr:membrane protein insertion efficiency factor YidD [Candidatus Paceibacterota bacterium]
MIFPSYPMKLKIYSIKLINFYQRNISVLIKPSCVFYPTCSEYTKQAIKKYGLFKGIRLGFFRILRCHQWQKNHIDPVVDFDEAP